MKVGSAPAYPLAWPEHTPRTPAGRREFARFKMQFGTARDRVVNELKLLGARYVVLSSNVPTRHDGLPYADMREPDDPGVAVYFDLRGHQHCLACDRWRKVRDNLHAIGLTVEALRGIARWGSSEIMQRAFAGFQALPPAPNDWRAVFGFDSTLPQPTLQGVRERFRRLAMQAHPDQGGNHDAMTKLNQAMEAAERELR